MARRNDPFDIEITPELIVRAYRAGIFPMSESAGSTDVFWVSPEQRGIIPLDGLIVYGRTRDECLQRLRRAIDEFVIDGIKTTLPLFQRLIREPDILAGNYDIHWLEKYLATAD
jgi:hypothetical protein